MYLLTGYVLILQAVFADQCDCSTRESMAMIIRASSAFDNAQAVPDDETRTLKVRAACKCFPDYPNLLAITVRDLFQEFHQLIDSELLHTAVGIGNGRFRGRDYPDLSAA